MVSKYSSKINLDSFFYTTAKTRYQRSIELLDADKELLEYLNNNSVEIYKKSERENSKTLVFLTPEDISILYSVTGRKNINTPDNIVIELNSNNTNVDNLEKKLKEISKFIPKNQK